MVLILYTRRCNQPLNSIVNTHIENIKYDVQCAVFILEIMMLLIPTIVIYITFFLIWKAYFRCKEIKF